MSAETSPSDDPQSEQSWRAVRERVLERDGYECRFCGKTDEEHIEETDRGLDVHHIIPESDGGRDTMRNLVALCRSCHRTMETLHGQAVGEIADDSGLREGLKEARRETHATMDAMGDIEDALLAFLDGHPVFEKEIGASRLEGVADVDRLDAGLSAYGHVDIDTEWQFAAAWGYKEGVLDAMNRIEGKVNFGIVNDE
jgi:hypothetical protein